MVIGFGILWIGILLIGLGLRAEANNAANDPKTREAYAKWASGFQGGFIIVTLLYGPVMLRYFLNN